MHATVRAKTVEYMWTHRCAASRAHSVPPPPLHAVDHLCRSWFQGFVVGDTEGFSRYLDEMRASGTWGDDPEIQVTRVPPCVRVCARACAGRIIASHVQAMCELYDRPAEIFVFDAALGARRLRTFHAARSASRPPIRLSYYGGGHYDSVVWTGMEAACVRRRRCCCRRRGRRDRRVRAWCCVCTACAHGAVYVPRARMVLCMHRVRAWCCVCTACAHGAVYVPRARMELCMYRVRAWCCVCTACARGAVYVPRARMVLCMYRVRRADATHAIRRAAAVAGTCTSPRARWRAGRSWRRWRRA